MCVHRRRESNEVKKPENCARWPHATLHHTTGSQASHLAKLPRATPPPSRGANTAVATARATAAPKPSSSRAEPLWPGEECTGPAEGGGSWCCTSASVYGGRLGGAGSHGGDAAPASALRASSCSRNEPLRRPLPRRSRLGGAAAPSEAASRRRHGAPRGGRTLPARPAR